MPIPIIKKPPPIIILFVQSCIGQELIIISIIKIKLRGKGEILIISQACRNRKVFFTNKEIPYLNQIKLFFKFLTTFKDRRDCYAN